MSREDGPVACDPRPRRERPPRPALEGAPRAPYLVRWIMCDGMGPRIFSIITRCSRFSWVCWNGRDRASRGQYPPPPPQKK